MNSGSLLLIARILASRPEDPGHDSPEELRAVEAVEAYARSVGGGGGSVVQAYGAAKTEITAFMDPGYDDGVVINIKAGRTLWAHADNFDEKIPDDAWKRLDDPKEQNFASRKHAAAVDSILRRHFAAQLKASAPANGKH